MALRLARRQSTEEILLKLDLDAPVDLNQWKLLAGIPIGGEDDDDDDSDEDEEPVLNPELEEFLKEQE